MNPWQYIDRGGRVLSCSWCQKAQHVAPRPDESHGICPSHSRQILSSIGAVVLRYQDGVSRVVPAPLPTEIRKHDVFPSNGQSADFKPASAAAKNQNPPWFPHDQVAVSRHETVGELFTEVAA